MKNTVGKVASVTRAINILKCLRGGAQKGLVVISQEAGLHVATTRRLLLTMVDSDFVRYDPENKKYSLGASFLGVSQKGGFREDLIHIAKPFLGELMEISGETSNLAIRSGDEVLYIEQAECSNYLRTANKVGSRAPLYCTGVGKIFLSTSPAEEIEAYLRNTSLIPFTPKTINKVQRLRRELERVAKRNLALDHEEQMIGEHCLAAGIRNADTKTIAAISISGPVFRLTRERMKEMAPVIQEIASKISQQIALENVL